MKRDMDLIRDILLALEADPRPSIMLTHGSQPLVDTDMRTYHGHLSIMENAGLLLPLKRSSNPVVHYIEISNAGHDFLDSVRDPKVWRKTKQIAGKSGGWTAKLLGEIAAGIVKANLQSVGISAS